MEKERKKKQNVSTFEIPSRLLPLESRFLCFQFCEVAYQETRFILRQTNRSGFYDKYFFSCFNDENCVDCVFGVQASLLQPISSKMSICFSNRNILNFCSHRHNLKIHKNTFFWALFASSSFFAFSFHFQYIEKKNVLNGYTKKKSSSWPTSLNNLSHKPQQVSCPL